MDRAKLRGPFQRGLMWSKRILSAFLALVSVCCLVIASWLCIDRFVLKSPVPSFCGYAVLTVSSPSMTGALDVGDMIVIRDTGDYEIGDIITFLPDGDSKTTTHRIVGKTENGAFLTKGDFNDSVDGDAVTQDRIFGEVVARSAFLGRLIAWLKGDGWLYLVAFALVLFIGLRMMAEGRRERESKEESDGSDGAK